jgi:peroxiredoxin
MAQFESQKEEVTRHGSLVFIAAEKRGGLFKPEKFLEKTPISFPFLLDEDRAVTKKYGVYKAMGIDSINIARPATLVVDASGKIRYLYVGSNQTDRAPIDKVLHTLHSIDQRDPTYQT